MGTTRFLWQRHWASSRRLRVSIFAALCTVSVSIALFLGLAFHSWLVLPFVGVELAALATAFAWIEVAAFDRDEIEVDERSVVVHRRRGLKIDSHRFDRAWVAVALDDAGACDAGVLLTQSGRSVRVAEYLAGGQRRDAARRLRAAIAA